MFCENCGASLPDGAAFCTSCGNQVAASAAQPAAAPQPAPAAAPQPEAAPAAQPVPVAQVPVNAAPAAAVAGGVPNWKTNVGFSILGIVLASVVNGIASALGNAGIIVQVAYVAIGVWYALAKFPSFFNGNGVNDPKIVSLLNGLFGGIIFGCLWNSNLTKGVKGVSNIVFVVLVAVGFVLGFIGGLMG